MFDQFKSKSLENYLKKEFVEYFENSGEDMSVDLKTDRKYCSISVTLAGESTPVKLEIGKYEIVSDGDDRRIKICDVSCDKKWIDAALSKYIKSKSFRIPLFVAAAL